MFKLKQLFLSLRRRLSTATARLSVSYLCIIMLMSVGFSVVFYHTSYRELGRQIPPPSTFGVRQFSDLDSGRGPHVDSFFNERIAQGRQVLLDELIAVNVAALVIGGLISYRLARRTLSPIEANMEAQSQFVSDASHELRTPLTALQTMNEVALRKKTMSAADTKDLLRYNIAEVEKLKQLTDALLRLARSEAISLTQTISIRDVATDALNNIIDGAVQKNISVEDTIAPFSIAVDRSSLTQALVTILDNAVKYSPAGSVIHLTAGLEGKTAFIRVRDEGMGIDPKDLPHIFDRFYRADQSRNKQQTDGYGIGLALAKKIVDLHHGEIIAASSKAGTSFTIRLPQA